MKDLRQFIKTTIQDVLDIARRLGYDTEFMNAYNTAICFIYFESLITKEDSLGDIEWSGCNTIDPTFDGLYTLITISGQYIK